MINFDELNLFDVASLIWRAKIKYCPIVQHGEDLFQISNVECIEGEIIITVKPLKELNEWENV